MIDENLDWFKNGMELKLKFGILDFQDDIGAQKYNLESHPNENLNTSRDTFQPLLSMSLDSLFHDPHNPPTSMLNDVQLLVSSSGHIQGS